MARRSLLQVGTIAAGTIVALMGIGACTSSGGGGGGSAVHGVAAAPVPADPAAGASQADVVDPKTPSSGAAAKSAILTGDVTIGTAKIRIAQIAVVVKRGESVSAQADAATAVALAHGGEVDADDRQSGTSPSATLILKVPPDDLPAVLDELAKLGVEKSRHLSTEDVTSKVADVNSRVTSARESILRLRELYAHATKVGDVINIESELSTRESDLESLEAQQRALASQTSTATITLSLSSPPKAVAKPPATHHRSGFVGGLQNGWDAFVRGAAWVATAVGAVLPFAVLALVLLVLARLLWPRLRPAGTPASAPVPPQA